MACKENEFCRCTLCLATIVRLENPGAGVVIIERHRQGWGMKDIAKALRISERKVRAVLHADAFLKNEQWFTERGMTADDVKFGSV
jgi:hypothetical protein